MENKDVLIISAVPKHHVFLIPIGTKEKYYFSCQLASGIKRAFETSNLLNAWEITFLHLNLKSFYRDENLQYMS